MHEEQNYSIEWMCLKLGINRAAYYKWLKRPIPAKEQEDIEIAEDEPEGMRTYAVLTESGDLLFFNVIAKKSPSSYKSVRTGMNLQ